LPTPAPVAIFGNHNLTDQYAEQLREDVKYRRKWCEKIGLGFVLPTNVSQLSQPKPNAAARKKAA
jgi:hypothetical protein